MMDRLGMLPPGRDGRRQVMRTPDEVAAMQRLHDLGCPEPCRRARAPADAQRSSQSTRYTRRLAHGRFAVDGPPGKQRVAPWRATSRGWRAVAHIMTRAGADQRPALSRIGAISSTQRSSTDQVTAQQSCTVRHGVVLGAVRPHLSGRFLVRSRDGSLIGFFCQRSLLE